MIRTTTTTKKKVRWEDVQEGAASERRLVSMAFNGLNRRWQRAAVKECDPTKTL